MVMLVVVVDAGGGGSGGHGNDISYTPQNSSYLNISPHHIQCLVGKPVLVKNSTDQTDNAEPSHTASSSDDEIEVLSDHVADVDNETEIDEEKTQTNTDVGNEMFVSAVQTQHDEELVVLSSNDKAVF